MKREDGRIPELDGFRVLMVFLVSWYHFWQQSWLTPYIGSYSLDYLIRAGYMPVDGTILLSGFLLFLPCARAYLRGEELPSPRSFFRKRIMRIVPSFWLITLLMLFVVVLPYHLYTDRKSLAYDVAMHLLLILNWDRRTYLGTQLGGSSWTAAVEMQLYVLVPLLSRLARKKPLAVMASMMAVSAYFRVYCLFTLKDFSMVVNQPVSFLDVYAMGMGCAFLYEIIRKKYDEFAGELEDTKAKRRLMLMQLAATVTFLLGFWGFLRVLRVQAQSPGFEVLQAGQMVRRPILSLTLSLVLLSLPFCVLPIRALFGNPLMHFLSVISFNYYLIHQNLAVYLRRVGVPYSAYENPNYESDRPWQYRFTILCFVLSLLAATLATFLVEKPCAKGLKKLFEALDRKKETRKQKKIE
ncbi:MAG: acyltransferase [Clostridia bacterium]|nr:acyltransferase [Clostridia bacterium]